MKPLKPATFNSLMLADPKPPSYVRSIQEWFASIIVRPIDINSNMAPLPSGEAAEIIAPSLKLTSDQRIQIYNRQYWWRLLTILHENFPALTRLFGYTDFNLSIGIPFLTKYTSRHWSVAKLGHQLARWIENYYCAEDQLLVLHTAKLDWAYMDVFFAPPPRPLPPSLLSKKVLLQPHVKLFHLPYDLFSYRTALLKESVEFWIESDFPPLPKGKSFFFLLYRTEANHVLYREMSQSEGTLLCMIVNGLTIEEACDQLENKALAQVKAKNKWVDIYEEARRSLSSWVQNWVKEKLFK